MRSLVEMPSVSTNPYPSARRLQQSWRGTSTLRGSSGFPTWKKRCVDRWRASEAGVSVHAWPHHRSINVVGSNYAVLQKHHAFPYWLFLIIAYPFTSSAIPASSDTDGL